MITLTSLSKIYRTDEIETVALENVNLTVERGEFLSIMGPSGCGKSTLLNIMGLLDAPTTGTIEINGTHTEGMKDKQLAAFRNKTLGFVFQSFHLINSLNVMDNVELPLLYRRISNSERKRLARASIKEESDFSSPEYIASYYMEEMRHLCVEKVMLLLLDGRHRLMKEILLSKGTANSSWVPVRTIFVEALRYEAVYMILIHNHPSGCPEPSREDLVITKQIKEAGELLGIPLSDHIIIGDKCYTSLREQQMM